MIKGMEGHNIPVRMRALKQQNGSKRVGGMYVEGSRPDRTPDTKVLPRPHPDSFSLDARDALLIPSTNTQIPS